MSIISLDEAKEKGIELQRGDHVAFQDSSGRVRIGFVKIRHIFCGKPNCTQCPHFSYLYLQYRTGNKVRDFYVGKYTE